MSTYKLYYFDSRGTGEPARLIFAQAGVKYEDIRITHEQWGTSAHKHCKQSKMPSRLTRFMIVCCVKRYAIWTHASIGS